jgi:choline-sulfatase
VGSDTPAIDGLRRDGVLFERAYTPAPLTLPAHVSILTGLLPPEHGARDNIGYPVQPDLHPMVQQRLSDAGYATGAAVSAWVLRAATGIATGFDHYDDAMAPVGGVGLQAVQRAGDETLAAILPWLRGAEGEPFFLFLHLFEPHSPYAAPEPFGSRYEDPYDGEIAAADAIVGRLLDELRALHVYDDALIILLSDHGEGLGEHGEREHGVFLYRSTCRCR